MNRRIVHIARGATLRYLRRHSSDLNPIEMRSAS